MTAASLRDPDAAARSASACDAIVNLSGEPVGQRWSRRVKEAVERTRTELPRRFLEALAPPRPATYLCASGIGYYGTSESATFVEESPPGSDFLARVCVAWEADAMRAADLGMRAAVVRTGVALGRDGGALAKLLPPFRAGLGGKVGSGRQWFSWIHIDDVVRIYLALLERGEGAYNATAPNPVTNAQFTKTLAQTLHRPAFLPVPAPAIHALLGEGAMILLEGQRVLPRRTTEDFGYKFAFADLGDALADLLARPSG